MNQVGGCPRLKQVAVFGPGTKELHGTSQGGTSCLISATSKTKANQTLIIQLVAVDFGGDKVRPCHHSFFSQQ